MLAFISIFNLDTSVLDETDAIDNPASSFEVNHITPSAICHFPRAYSTTESSKNAVAAKKKKSKCGKTRILTDSPEIEQIKK